MKGYLENTNGDIKKVKIGFSWTVFFFGFFVPFFRKDFVWGILFFIAIALIALFSQLGGGALNFYFAIIYNKLYIEGLIKQGYLPTDPEFKKMLEKKKIHIPESTSLSKGITL